jgi:hypothetical protein
MVKDDDLVAFHSVLVLKWAIKSLFMVCKWSFTWLWLKVMIY